MRKVPENNSYKKEIEEIVKLCEKRNLNMVKEIIRMLKEESKISKAAEDLFMKFMKNAEEREKHSEE